MRVDDFDYFLPEELIAQVPILDRSSSKLMVLDKETGKIEHKTFKNVIDYLNPGDCLVLNNTRVIPARLIGEKVDTGGKIEFLLLKRTEEDTWQALVKPGKRAKIGTKFSFGNGKLIGEVVGLAEEGSRIIKFHYEGIFEEVLDELGNMPLPPYITERLEERERYQTVYSKHNGSAAAPTAGLHFTDNVLQAIRERNITTQTVCLHVGAGTFLPVKSSLVSEHTMHREPFVVTLEFLEKLLSKTGKLVAVGTTSVRTLESLYYVGVKCIETGAPADVDQWDPYSREYTYSLNEALSALVEYLKINNLKDIQLGTRIIIVPGYEFKVVDILVTNFHQPQSTLLLLISAFVKGDWHKIYDFALANEFRFLSYGDSSVLFRE